MPVRLVWILGLCPFPLLPSHRPKNSCSQTENKSQSLEVLLTPSSEARSETLDPSPITADSPPVWRSCKSNLRAFTGNGIDLNSGGATIEKKKEVRDYHHANTIDQQQRTLFRPRSCHDHCPHTSSISVEVRRRCEVRTILRFWFQDDVTLDHQCLQTWPLRSKQRR